MERSLAYSRIKSGSTNALVVKCPIFPLINPIDRFQIPIMVSLSNHALGGNRPKATAWLSLEKRGSTGSPRTNAWELDSQNRKPALRRVPQLSPMLSFTC
jgi:hypothetical protein